MDERILRHSNRLAVDKTDSEGGEQSKAPTPLGRTTHRGAETVLLQARSDVRAPLAALSDLLAQITAADFGDRVCLLRAEASGASAESGDKVGPDSVHRATIPRERMRAEIESRRKRFDYLFLDVADGAPEIASDGLDIKVFLTRHGDAPSGEDAKGARRLIHALALDTESRGRASGSGLRALRAWAAETSTQAKEGQSYAEDVTSRARANDARLRIHFNDLKAIWQSGGSQSLDDIADALDARRPPGTGLSAREGLSSLARCITRRRLGLALGGGGTLGFAHVILIRRMVEAGLPIDLVCGSSFGATTGAYYCAKPRGGDEDGLSLLVERAGALQRITYLCPLTSSPVAMVVNEDLDSRPVDSLDVRFLPVAVDLVQGATVVITSGTVGFSVRASGSLPGFFTPTTVRGARYVDGGLLENVPASAAHAGGADMVVASNVFPSQGPESAREPRLGGTLGRLLFELNPINRLRDGARTLNIMMHRMSSLQAGAATKVVSHEMPAGSRYHLWDFRSAQKVMDWTEERMDRDGIIKDIEDAWRHTCGVRSRA